MHKFSKIDNPIDKIKEHEKAEVKLYILNGHDFAQKDLFSASDPYLILKCGAFYEDERKNYQLDEPNPKFNKCYTFKVDFPGAPTLEISAYDFDDIFSDEIIGKTVIDLDDRFYNS